MAFYEHRIQPGIDRIHATIDIREQGYIFRVTWQNCVECSSNMFQLFPAARQEMVGPGFKQDLLRKMQNTVFGIDLDPDPPLQETGFQVQQEFGAGFFVFFSLSISSCFSVVFDWYSSS